MKIVERKTRVRVCVNVTCCQRGSKQVYDELAKKLDASECEVYTSEDCFRFCKSGPNVSVDGTVLHDMRPAQAADRVKREIAHPSRKVDTLGSRSIDELDEVLDSLFL